MVRVEKRLNSCLLQLDLVATRQRMAEINKRLNPFLSAIRCSVPVVRIDNLLAWGYNEDPTGYQDYKQAMSDNR